MSTPVWRTVPAAVLLVALAGCGVGVSGAQPAPDAPVIAGVAKPATRVPLAKAFPTELVGTWYSTPLSLRMTFTADGHFDASSYRGTATVRGQTMTLQTDTLSAVAWPWSISAGVLRLGTTTYTRTGGTISIVGRWLDVTGKTTIRFGSDRSFAYTSDTEVIAGTYTLLGNRLTLFPRTRQPLTYVVSLGTVLTFSSLEGRVLGRYERAR